MEYSQSGPHVLYTIHAHSNSTMHCSHNVGLFTTYEKAQAVIARDHDDDDYRPLWSYHVLMVTRERLSDHDIKELDTIPDDFPYPENEYNYYENLSDPDN